MRAIVLDRPGSFRVAEVPDPAPRRPTDAVANVLVSGVSPADAAIRVSPFRVYNDELTIVGSMAVLRSSGPAAGPLGGGAVDPHAMPSAPPPLDQFGEAVDRDRPGQGIQMAHPAVMTGAITSWARAGE
jgi:hypothetical protein